MTKNQPSDDIEGFVTQEEFNLFKKELDREFENVRTIIVMQNRQIDLAHAHKQEYLQEVSKNIMRNNEIELQNQTLKLKIAELQCAISTYHMHKFYVQGQNTLKSVRQYQKKLNEQPILPEMTSQISLSSSEFLLESEDQSINDSSKYLIQNHKTKQTQSALEQDDEELIECVWYDSEKKDIKANSLNNENHHHNPQGKEFTIQNQGDCVSITKINGSGFLCPSHTFVYKDSVPFERVSKFKVKIVKVKDLFLIGVGTIYVFGVQNAFRHNQSISYSSKGDLWLDGDSKKIGKPLKYNQQVEIRIDRIKGTVSWLVQDIQMTKINIPSQMASKQLFLTLMMFNKDDKLHLYPFK